MREIPTPKMPNFAVLNQDFSDITRMKAERENELNGRYDAQNIFEHLMHRVEAFQKSLDDEHEVGLRLANFGIAAEINIRSIGYKNPNLIEFSGLSRDMQEVTLVQHISQLNFLLIAAKPLEEQPFRIGFLAKD